MRHLVFRTADCYLLPCLLRVELSGVGWIREGICRLCFGGFLRWVRNFVSCHTQLVPRNQVKIQQHAALYTQLSAPPRRTPGDAYGDAVSPDCDRVKQPYMLCFVLCMAVYATLLALPSWSRPLSTSDLPPNPSLPLPPHPHAPSSLIILTLSPWHFTDINETLRLDIAIKRQISRSQAGTSKGAAPRQDSYDAFERSP